MTVIIEKANELLATLIANGADATVINAQKAHIKKLEGKEAKELTIPENASIYIKSEGEVKQVKICKVRSQRPIKQSRVNEFLQILKDEAYEQGMPLILITVAKAKELGLTLEDFKGNEVTDIVDETWIVIIEGQHRCIAGAIYNEEEATEEGTEFVFENTILKEEEGFNYRKYIASINGKETSNFSNEDHLALLALGCDEELPAAIAEHKDKLSLSTRERAMTGGITISKSKYSKALKESVTLTSLLSEKESSKLDIQLGKRLLDACLATGVSPKRISRYWIEGFYAYVAAHDETKAFEAIAKITPENYSSISSGNEFTTYLKRLNEVVANSPQE